ncbi:MAG: glycosyltransferase [Pseudonocardiales bacterium]
MIGGIALVVVGIGLLYCFGSIGAGLLEFRRRGHRISDQAGDRYDATAVAESDEAPASGLRIYGVVAALDEAAVIGPTVGSLLAQPGDIRVVLVDDGSTDATADIARQAGGDRIEVIRREMPDARLGKGEALNAAFEYVTADVRRRGLDPDHVLVCVMDADGRLSAGAVTAVTALFEDNRIGGVQLAVRIRNRTSLLTTMQDFEFWGVSAVAQIGRIRTGTVSLGGNGQFTRLSALLGLGRPPWSSSLTEDLDLTISLLTHGWRLTSSVEASVEQEAVSSVRQLLRQRTRWFQGHMICGRRLPEIWRSHQMSHAAVLELSLYLSIPWLLVLPWSVLFHVGLLGMARSITSGNAAHGGGGWARLANAFAWYLLSFSPSLAFGFIYLRRNRHVRLLRALLLSHLLIGVTYLGYAAVWGALRRILRGETGWDKTQRVTAPAPFAPLVSQPPR